MTIVVNDLLDENGGEDEYVEESDDDLRAEMDQDDELRSIMNFVFGPDSDDED